MEKNGILDKFFEFLAKGNNNSIIREFLLKFFGSSKEMCRTFLFSKSIDRRIISGDYKKGEKRLTMLCLHGHGRGKIDVAGIAKDDIERQQYINIMNYDYGRQFAKAGYVVLAPDARSFGERKNNGENCYWATSAAFLLGKTLVGMRTWDAIRSLDYLETREEVDKNRMGCVGLSWGGTHTIFTSVFDERIKVAIVSGYFSSFKDALIDRWGCMCQFIPNLLLYADLSDIVSLIAPRPLLIENGVRDPLYNPDIVKREFDKVKNAYKLLDAEEKIDLDMFEGAHQFSGRKAFDWVNKWL